MKLTIEELDQLYGTKDLEVYRHSPQGLFTDSPLLMGYFHDRTCKACGTKITKRPFVTTKVRKELSGHTQVEPVTVQAKGYFLYLRPRGSEQVLPTEVLFLHSYCLDKIYYSKLETMTIGPNWVPQSSVVRA